MRIIQKSNVVILVILLITVSFQTHQVFSQTGTHTKDMNSQSDQGEDAYYGVKAGVNFAELFGDDAIPESDRKIGYSFGIYGTYKISKNFKLQPEIIWSLQGEDSKKSGRYKISYINVPIMLKKTQNKWYTEIGPQLGILTINTSKSVPDDIRLENFQTFDFSINAGVGYKLFEDCNIGIRYCQGLTNLVKNKDLKNSVIYIGISYHIF